MILVSGGTGLIGNYLLLNLCKKPCSIRALYTNEESLLKTKKFFNAMHLKAEADTIEWLKVDINDRAELEAAFEGINRVYHCAALVSFSKSDAEDLMETNVQGTSNMVNISLDKQIEKFCYVSSVAAVGSAINTGDLITENCNWENSKKSSDYSISKYLAENEVWRAGEEGLNIVIVNPATILGFGNWNRGSSAIFKTIKKGLSFFPSGANGFVSVNDVVNAMTLLMESDISHERFILVNKNYSFKTVFSLMAKSLEKTPPKIYVPERLAMIFAVFMGFFSKIGLTNSPVNSQSTKTAYSMRAYSSEKLIKQCNFEMLDFEKEIENYGRLYLKYPNLWD